MPSMKPAKSNHITLRPDQWTAANKVAKKKFAKVSKHNDGKGGLVTTSDQSDPFKTIFRGILGEVAFGAMYQIPPYNLGGKGDFDFEGPRVDGVKSKIELKTARPRSKREWESLIVAGERLAKDSDILVLMVGDQGVNWRFAGWHFTDHVMVPKYWKEDDPKYEKDCWRFPQLKLKFPKELYLYYSYWFKKEKENDRQIHE